MTEFELETMKMLEEKLLEESKSNWPIRILRVPGGWIFQIPGSEGSGEYRPCFVPINKDRV
jgi:hypothetical protein